MKITGYLKTTVSAAAPAAVTLAIILYIHALHLLLYFGSARFGLWLAALAAPPLALEYLFTKSFEAKKSGWRLSVITGFAVRAIFILALFYVFVWRALALKNTPDMHSPFLATWPYGLLFFWTATPIIAIILGSLLAAAYLSLTVRFRLFRFGTAVLLPGIATYVLLYLFYFMPTSPVRLDWRERPDFVEPVFTAANFNPKITPFGRYGAFSREVYVGPRDDFALASFGAIFGSKINNQPNMVWMNLKSGEYEIETMETVKHFQSECPDAVYFSPMHGSTFYSFDSREKKLHKFALPPTLNGYPVNEIFFTYHACETNRVYFVSLWNPAMFVWDTRKNQLDKTIGLVGKYGITYRDNTGVIARNPRLGRVYAGLIWVNFLIEFDEKTLNVERVLKVPSSFYDATFSKDGKKAYISGMLSGAIWKFDVDSWTLERTFRAPRHCRRIALSRDGSLLFAASFLTGELLVYDTESGRKILNVYITPKPEGLSVTDKYVYALGAEGLFRISQREIRSRK